MKTVSIISLSKASLRLPQLADKRTICYFLSEDYQLFISLKHQFGQRVQLKTLSGLFNETLQKNIEPYQELIAGINKDSDSFHWWGYHLASKSSSALPLFRNTVYLFCCEQLLSQSESDIIFVVDSPALGICIKTVAFAKGWKVTSLYSPVVNLWRRLLR